MAVPAADNSDEAEAVEPFAAEATFVRTPGVGVGVTLGVGVAVGVTEGVGVTLGVGVAEGVGEAEGVAVGEGVGLPFPLLLVQASSSTILL